MTATMAPMIPLGISVSPDVGDASPCAALIYGHLPDGCDTRHLVGR
jgi:hypothetical protein